METTEIRSDGTTDSVRSTEQRIGELRRWIWVALWFRATVYSAAVGLWICGCAIMAARLLWEAPITMTLWSLLLLPLLTIAAAFYAARRVPGEWMLRAELDRVNQADGLLMAEGEIALDKWEEIVQGRIKRRPVVSWDTRRALAMFLPAVVFTILTLALPLSWLRNDEPRGGPRLDVAAAVNHLEQQLQTLEDLSVIEKEEVDSLREEINRVEENARGDSPAKTLESLQHAQTQLATLAEQSATKAAETARNAGQLADAADTLSGALQGLPESSLEDAMKELSKLTKEAAEDAEQTGLAGCEGLQEAAEMCDRGLSPGDLKDLAQSLKDCFDKNSDLLNQLAQNGLLDPQILKDAAKRLTPMQIQQIIAELKKCQGGCPIEAADLEEILLEAGIILDKDGEGQCIGAILCAGLPGRGGISRGPGAAKLQFNGETDEQDAIFNNEILTPGGLDTAAGSVRTAITRGGPSEDEERATSVAGGLSGSAGSGGSYTRRILPQHRAVVEDYFNRNRQSTEETP